MDCGPAALAALLTGLGVRVSYGRLREACQTDVDGTSIDVLEELCGTLGLEATQVMLPLDHLLRDEAAALPALAVVRLPHGDTHFVVLWRRHGPFVQVMDPAAGRRLVPWARLRRELFVHETTAPAAAFREYAATAPFRDALAERLRSLGAPARALLETATADPGPAGLAGLDAAARLCAELRASGAIRGGAQAAGLLAGLLGRIRARPAEALGVVPATHWYARPLPPDGDGDAADAAEPMVRLRGAVLVSVRPLRGGHAVLSAVDLAVAPGSHVAIVGTSGAGKSSLIGLLLGLHAAAEGTVLVDGEPLDGPRREQLRLETAWVDPAVRLWNRSLLANLRYGAGDRAGGSASDALESAGLLSLVRRLPDGMATALGEGGGRLSGGEGQRVRLGRALQHERARLVLLDEAFRGVDREMRRRLLAGARARFAGATLLCVTHDVTDTTGFDRVLVMADGRLAEDGAPAALAAAAGSRYAALLAAEERARAQLWGAARWRRLTLRDGQLVEGPRGAP